MISNKFIILSGGRTGSTYLQRLLNSHPSVTCYDEIFNVTNTNDNSFYSFSKREFPIISWLFLRGKVSGNPLNFPLKYLFQKYIQSIYPENHTEKIGFKLIYDQLLYYYPVGLWLAKNSIPVIHLRRKNLVKAAVSLIKAKNSGVYVSTLTDHSGDKKINIHPRDILKELNRQSDERLKCEAFVRNNQMITVYYEDLFEDQPATLQKITDFLKIENNSLEKPDITKTNPEKLSEVLENFADVKKSFKGTAWEEYLN